MANDIFSWLLDQGKYKRVRMNDGTIGEAMILNSIAGLAFLGKLQVVNSVTKSAKPWHLSNIYFQDKTTKRFCMVQYCDMCCFVFTSDSTLFLRQELQYCSKSLTRCPTNSHSVAYI